MTLDWQENDDQILFDPSLKIVERIFLFIESAVQKGVSTLIFSKRGQSRACCVLTAYLMRKFKWSLLKTLEFLNFRRPDLEIRASFFHQLTSFEAKLMRKFGSSNFSSTWESKSKDEEELIITNTYMNAINLKYVEKKPLISKGMKELLESINRRESSISKSSAKNRFFCVQ